MPEVLGINDLIGDTEEDTVSINDLYKKRIAAYNITGPETPAPKPPPPLTLKSVKPKITDIANIPKMVGVLTEAIGKPLHRAGSDVLAKAKDLGQKYPVAGVPLYLGEIVGGAFNAMGPGSFEFADRMVNPEKYQSTTGGEISSAVGGLAKNVQEFPAQAAENIRELHKKAGLPFAEYNPAAWALENVGTPVTNLFGDRTDEQVKADAKKSIEADPSMAAQTAVMALPLGKVGKRISAGVPEGLLPAKSRFHTPAGKELVKDITTIDEAHQRMAGTAIEEAHNAGLNKANKATGEAIGQALQVDPALASKEIAPTVQGIRSVLNAAWQKAKDVGVDIGQIKNYFPRILKREIRDQLSSGLDKVESELRKGGSFSDAAVIRALKKTNIVTEEALKHIVESGGGKSLSDALKELRRSFANRVVSESPFTKPRTLKLPSSFYETDARIVIPEYLNSIYKQIAWTEKWGPNVKGLRQKLAGIGKLSRNEADLGRTMVERWSGSEKRPSPKWERAASIFTKVEVATKIFAGTAALKQLTQPAISFVFKSGFWDSAKGWGRMMTKEGRSSARQSGALEQSVMFQMVGDLPEGNAGDVYRIIERNHPFTILNRGLQYWSALTAEQSLNRWYRQAQSKGYIGDIARNHLDQFGVDPSKPLTKELLQEKMYRFTTDGQMQRNILNDPVFFNDPHYRPFVLFKRFGYRQAAWMAENLERDVFQNKNPLPLLRLMSLGIVGGEFSIWADNKIREWTTGTPQYREEDIFTMRRAINDLASVGAMGVISDIAGSRLERLGGAVSRAIIPVVFSDVDRMADAFTETMKSFKATGSVSESLTQNASKIAGPFGSLVSGLSGRVQTDTQKQNEADSRKLRKRDEILDLVVAGDSKNAIRLLDLWNANSPDNPIQPHEMSTKDLLTHATSRTSGIINDLLAAGKEQEAHERHKAWNIMYPKFQLEDFDVMKAKSRRNKILRDRDRRREVIRYGPAIDTMTNK